MKIKYELNKNITFEELCEIVCMAKRQGYNINSYLVNDDNDYMDVYFSKQDKSFSINDNGYTISLSGFIPEEALEQYKWIIDKIDKEKNE